MVEEMKREAGKAIAKEKMKWKETMNMVADEKRKVAEEKKKVAREKRKVPEVKRKASEAFAKEKKKRKMQYV
eukprot:5756179-Ditylum_brightwellii.AAC.2